MNVSLRRKGKKRVPSRSVVVTGSTTPLGIVEALNQVLEVTVCTYSLKVPGLCLAQYNSVVNEKKKKHSESKRESEGWDRNRDAIT
jgi:hypothetical protein